MGFNTRFNFLARGSDCSVEPFLPPVVRRVYHVNENADYRRVADVGLERKQVWTQRRVLLETKALLLVLPLQQLLLLPLLGLLLLLLRLLLLPLLQPVFSIWPGPRALNIYSSQSDEAKVHRD